MRIFPLLLALGGLTLAGQTLAAPPPAADGALRFVPFEVLVKFKPGSQKTAIAADLANVRLTSRAGRYDVAKITNTLPLRNDNAVATSETLALLTRLRQRTDVEYAQLNYLVDFAATPSDPLYPQQWHYPLISLPGAWDITTGSGAVRIAILDSGRSGHPDLNGRWSPLEFNALSPGAEATDNGNWRHGTHVAGIAGAGTGNGIGGAGVCSGCTLMAVKIGEGRGGSIDAITAGIHWATDNGANVINISLAKEAACTLDPYMPLRDAIRRARDNGIVVIAAAGNGTRSNSANVPVDVDNVTPASCPGVISVAAVDRDGHLASYSNRGANIGIAAPGGGGAILWERGFGSWDIARTSSVFGTTVGTPACNADSSSYFNAYTLGVVSSWTTSPASGNSHCYRYLSGTSMATPHVAGTVGLMLSVKPTLRPDQVNDILRSTASAMPACGSDCGPGLLNAHGAVDAARNTSTGPCSADAGTTKAGCSIDSIGQYVDSAGTLTESVFAYGYLWQFDAAGHQIGRARKLRVLPRYAYGPCQYAPADQECTIDSSTVLDYPGFGYLESITAYGRYWNLDFGGSSLAGSGTLLSSVARFANGPCAYAGSAPCRFDTRNLLVEPEWGGLTESITAYGRYWVFDASGSQIETNTLLSVPRYASGPCAYRPAGSVCAFTSRELRRAPAGGRTETVTAYGRYFEWGTNGAPTANHGQLLTNIPRLR